MVDDPILRLNTLPYCFAQTLNLTPNVYLILQAKWEEIWVAHTGDKGQWKVFDGRFQEEVR